ncbi:MAG: LysM peptidoglycan-binding domain-containing protein [Candidatus Cyclobacteriaceae bacterium M3_2C_046]
MKKTILNKLIPSIVILFFLIYPLYSQDDSANDYKYEYIPDASYYEVEERIKDIPSAIPLSYNKRIKAFIDYFTIKDREYTRMILRRKNVFFPIFEKYLQKHNLPDELKYLSIIESGLNTRAISRVGAVGLWQFMPYTGKMFKLHQDWYVDERMDPEKATEAACLYLAQLYNMFDDWEMALASYNCGPGNVRKAIRRSGYKKTFWEVYPYLPRETRSYVPQFVAIIYVLNYAEEHNFFPEIDQEFPMAWETVSIDGFLHMPTLANLLGVCEEDLQNLNPQLKRNALPEETRNYPLKIPADKFDYFVLHQEEILDSASNHGKEEIEYIARNTVGSTYGREKVVYRVRSGDVLGTIASRYRVRVSDLRTWNNIRGNLIRVGQNLSIWVREGNVPSRVASSSRPAPLPSNKVYIVQPGDTLWHISRRYEGLSIEKIKQLNNLKGSEIKPGQKLVLG